MAKASSAAKNRVPAPVSPSKKRSDIIGIAARSEDEFYPAVARTLMRPEVGAAAAIEKWQTDTHDVNDLAKELAAQVEAVNSGDLRRAEGMLIAQAHTLSDVFNILLRRVTNQQYLPQWEAYMRMAMKAQSQCRMTLEALATIKNPPVVFAKQANINNGGQQQVNNGTSPHASPERAPASARKSESEQNKLLEAHDGEWLDTGAQGKASGADSQVEAMGALNRATERNRKIHQRAQCVERRHTKRIA